MAGGKCGGWGELITFPAVYPRRNAASMAAFLIFPQSMTTHSLASIPVS
jgi:hypothetical protein